MATPSGQRRHRITIKKPVTGADETTGEALQTLTDVATVWSKITFGSGREKWANDHTLNEYDAVITIRYRTDLLEDMQAHYGSDVFEIKSIIDPFMRKEELKLLCTRYG